MCLYIILFLSICFVYALLKISIEQSRRRENVFLILSGILLFILYFFKSESVGSDYITYLNFFDDCYVDLDYLLKDDLAGFEKGYIILNKLIYMIYPNHLAFTFVLAVFFSWCSCFLIRRYVMPIWMGLFLLCTLSVFTNSFCLVRQSIAMYICWLSISSIFNRKLFKFLLIILVAFFFHKTALIFAPVYFLANYKLTNFSVMLGLLISFFIGEFIHQIMGLLTIYLQANNYLNDGNDGGFTKLLFLLLSFFCIYFLNVKSRYNDKSSNLFINMLFMMLSIQIISLNFSILTRITDYFIISLCVLFPKIIGLKMWNKHGAFVRVLFVIFFIFFFYYSNKSNSFGIIPYNIF